jgi:hypothetical protein
MDDNLGVKEEEVQLPEEPPTSEQTTEEVPPVQEQEASETEQVETETEESKKGANQRIRELNAKAKAAEEKATLAEERAKSLSERLAEITEPIGFTEQPGVTPQYPQYKEGQEVPFEQLQQDVTSTANAIVDLKIKQNNAVNRINNEARDSIRKYVQLDPDSSDFNKELSDTVTEATEHYIRSNPYTASVTKFVDKLMKPYLGAVTKEVGQVTENIAKQVSETALRPTSVRKQEKPAADLSVEELEQKLGIVHS